jgi:aminoglycoside 2'-N-acetyltransferase I
MHPRIELCDGDETWPLADPLLEAVWPPDALASIAWGELVFADADLRILTFDEGDRLVSHIGLFLRDMRWGTRPVRVGGIGGVATRPESRRRGFASVGLARAATYFQNAKRDFGLLFCEEHKFDFYRGRGWRPFECPVLMEQPQGRVTLTSMTPFVLDLRLAPRSGELDLCGLPW